MKVDVRGSPISSFLMESNTKLFSVELVYLSSRFWINSKERGKEQEDIERINAKELANFLDKSEQNVSLVIGV